MDAEIKRGYRVILHVKKILGNAAQVSGLKCRLEMVKMMIIDSLSMRR